LEVTKKFKKGIFHINKIKISLKKLMSWVIGIYYDMVVMIGFRVRV
jgi:hypothetical protein